MKLENLPSVYVLSRLVCLFLCDLTGIPTPSFGCSPSLTGKAGQAWHTQTDIRRLLCLILFLLLLPSLFLILHSFLALPPIYRKKEGHVLLYECLGICLICYLFFFRSKLKKKWRGPFSPEFRPCLIYLMKKFWGIFPKFISLFLLETDKSMFSHIFWMNRQDQASPHPMKRVNKTVPLHP